MRIPTSTYRLQMTAEFGFQAAREVVPYLHRLGVTDAYLSPILRATPGSTHGYDVVDPTVLDPRLGTRSDFEAFSDALRERDMGLVLDIVPNHMAANVANPWWRDVLKRGRDSQWAGHFDIDWSVNDGKLLLPMLGGTLEEVLDRGELSVTGEGELTYWDKRLPLAEGTAGLGDVVQVVRAQHYELADWREQSRRLNYRRFFDITDLVGVRVEDERVFDDVHRLVLELVAEGRVTGVRVDHVDGLLDPRGYLERLQTALRTARGTSHDDGEEPFFVVIEKIFGEHEFPRRDWPIAGATGYRFLDVCDGLFVDADGAERLAQCYADVAGMAQPFDQIVGEAKLRIIREYFWGELTRLARMVLPDDDDDAELRRTCDAIAVTTAQLRVYRTYVEQERRPGEDDQLIERALARAASVEGVDPIALSRVARALRTDAAFTRRWQQFSGPVTAKSVEDTAFYRYYAVPARNEVGAHPSHPSAAAGSFHWLCAERASRTPGALNASSTHDTKRSEDVRARMLVLTEEPEEWSVLVERWLEELDAPDRNDGWMIASTLVGAWPIDQARLAEYVTKAVREEKLRTSWTDPDEEYEREIVAFAERLRTSGEIEPVVRRVAERGRRNSLAATALRLFAPGVPDVYQGSEVEFLALVDPDNRRPVDYDALDAQLDSPDAPAKLRLVSAALRARRADPELFACGEYLPLRIDAPGVLAYARRLRDRWAIVAVPLPGFVSESAVTLQLPDDAPQAWRHVVTDETVRPSDTVLSALIGDLPVLLVAGLPSASEEPARAVDDLGDAPRM